MPQDVRFATIVYGGLLWLLGLVLCTLVLWALRPAGRGAPRAAAGRSGILLAVLGLPAAPPFFGLPAESWLILAPILLVAAIALMRGAGRWSAVLLAVALALSLLRDLQFVAWLVEDATPLKHLAALMIFSAAPLDAIAHVYLGVLIDGPLLLLAARLVLDVAGLTLTVREIGVKEHGRSIEPPAASSSPRPT